MTGPQDGYASPLSALRNNVEDLAVALAIWSARDDTKPDAPARRAANDAVDAVDAMLAELHQLRQSLVSDIRDSDDRSAIRADKLLARTDDATKLPGPGRAGTEEDRALGTPGLE